ncbi:hypothetical protein BDB00DRAFT_182457 [Zychaea mexicana]|uniref:uncharacterized protein n=1 Tax=Zychaea mexicana TaxID=64656 RepID=UPI0022FF03B1|nr:uncharacterized protein BDB00DRAFT_182457 [Zychaea mexicana]KAI9496056.1 hypothetical protein BDB00DRAFT_182457 [Zychaea mexicana]
MKHIDTKNLLRTLKISKTWHTRLSDCPGIWSTIRIQGHLGFTEADLAQLAKISHHVENLELLDITDKHFCEGALVQIMRGTYKKLEKLEICDCKIQNISNLILAVSRVASTLTKLDISDRENLPLIPFGTVLWMCQNLREFRYSHKVVYSKQSLGSFGTPFMSSLTHLELCMRGFRGDCLEEILPRCQKLRFLTLDGCRSSTFSLIHRCCPDLEILVFNQFHYQWTKSLLDDNSATRKGLRYAIVNLDDLSEFVPYLNEHRETIEELGISMNFFDNGSGFRDLGELSNLKRLEISYTDAHATLASLLQKSPSVESLTLIGCDLRNVGIISAIETFKHLNNLKMVNKCDIIYEDMQHLLQSFAQPLDGQRLKDIALIEGSFMDDALLHMLLDIRSLTNITLSYCRRLTPQGINSFCENLSRLPDFHTFVMLGLRCVTDSTLACLYNVKTLKNVTLDSLAAITPGAVQALKHATNAKIDCSDCYEASFAVDTSDSEEEED